MRVTSVVSSFCSTLAVAYVCLLKLSYDLHILRALDIFMENVDHGN
jgi:hypothetical protein